jgi:hypothetical protein
MADTLPRRLLMMKGNKMERISYRDFREGKAEKKPAKYRNRKTEVDGILFDSQKEANHYCDLKTLKQQGEIIDFFRQVPFVISPGYYSDDGWHGPEIYKADFVVIPNLLVITNDENTKVVFAQLPKPEIHETKGFFTPHSKTKMRIFREKYPEYEVKVI